MALVASGIPSRANIQAAIDDAVTAAVANLPTMIQSGTSSAASSIAASSYADVAVTFTTAFASTPLVVASSKFQWVIASIYSQSATGFTVRLRNLNTSTAQTNVTANWIAVGSS
ncbi:MAG: hypothetical protein QM638_01290 [Nocardioides sp.]|uniref:hypothetical protein n=1 Tax=Nocardioides sp. TaxID=35761 RepID=UPI0039E3FC02